LKVSDLDPKEIKYICTLEWKPLMIYLEKKFGKKLKEDFVKTVAKNIQRRIDDTDKKWVN
jgi:hypothetical protein